MSNKRRLLTHKLPRTRGRIWRPTPIMVEILGKLARLKKPVHYMDVCNAWGPIAAMHTHGYVTVTVDREGSMVQITDAGRALRKAVQADAKLVRVVEAA